MASTPACSELSKIGRTSVIGAITALLLGGPVGGVSGVDETAGGDGVVTAGGGLAVVPLLSAEDGGGSPIRLSQASSIPSLSASTPLLGMVAQLSLLFGMPSPS